MSKTPCPSNRKVPEHCRPIPEVLRVVPDVRIKPQVQPHSFNVASCAAFLVTEISI